MTPAPFPRERFLLSGIDSLYVAYFFDASANLIDWDTLFYRQEQLKLAKRQESEPFQLGSELFLLHRSGKFPYRFVLSNAEFRIYLAEALSPCCYVQCLSEGLWRNGAPAQLAKLDTWAQSLGFKATRAPKVSRCDWAFDVKLEAVDFTEDHFRSRARKDFKVRDSGKVQTFQFGKGDIVTRVYDKVAEIHEVSQKAWFFDLWGCSEGVWRVEFQVRGPALEAHGISSPADLFDLQGDLLRELAFNHTTLRVPGKDSNRARWALHGLWSGLQALISEGPQMGLVRSLDPAYASRWRLARQVKTLRGTLKAFAAQLALLQDLEQPPTLGETVSSLKVHLLANHHPDLWAAEVQERMTQYVLGAA